MRCFLAAALAAVLAAVVGAVPTKELVDSGYALSDPATDLNTRGIAVVPPFLETVLGNQKQNVGNLIGGALYKEIYNAVEKLCPSNAVRCTSGKATIGVNYVQNSYYLGRGTLTLSVSASYYANDRMRRLLIGGIAGAAQMSSEDQKNCYTFKHQIGTGWASDRLCNIGNSIYVRAVGTLDHATIPELMVMVSSPTAHGHFDCVAVTRAVGNYQDKLLGEWKQVLGKSALSSIVTCPVKGVTERDIVEPDTPGGLPVEPRPPYRITTTMGNEKQSVGDLTGAALYHEVYQALEKLCPPGQLRCKPIPTTVGVNEISNTFLSRGELSVGYNDFFFKSEAIRRLVIGSVAAAVQKMTEDDKNCHKVQHNLGFNKFETLRFCNIAQFVKVRATGHGEGFSGHIGELHAVFKNPTKRGSFDCVAVCEAVADSQRALREEWKFELQSGLVSIHVDCPSKVVTNSLPGSNIAAEEGTKPH